MFRTMLKAQIVPIRVNVFFGVKARSKVYGCTTATKRSMEIVISVSMDATVESNKKKGIWTKVQKIYPAKLSGTMLTA